MKINWTRTGISMAALLVAAGAQATIITHGGTSINMDFVPVGNVSNAPSSTGYGDVAYEYNIGKYEVTADQWAAVYAAAPGIGNDNGGLTGSIPTRYCNWNEAARFCNWLTSGDPHAGAYVYAADGYTLTAIDRAGAIVTYGTVYVLPSEDEWVKAAYYRPAASMYAPYPTGWSVPTMEVAANYGGTNGTYALPWDVGTGSVESYGTYDMGGNVVEWLEDLSGANRIRRGGSYLSANEGFLNLSFREVVASAEYGISGFRVVSISAAPGYDGWAGGWGVDIGATTNDYDGDGLLNIYEYGLGGDPTNELDQGISPTFGTVNIGGTNWFGYVHPQLAAANSGINYHLELNTDLVSGIWTNAGYVVVGTNVTGGNLNFVTNGTDTVDSQKFIRLIIE